MVDKHMKGCGTSYVIREVQVKTIVKYHYNPLEWLKSKTLAMPNAGEDVEHLNAHSLLMGM